MRFTLLVFSFACLSQLSTVEAQSASPDAIRKAFGNSNEFSERLTQTKSALESFRKLTELIRGHAHSDADPKIALQEPQIPKSARYDVKLERTDLLAIGNLDWDVQTIGFQNWIDFIRAHQKSLEVENAKLQLENARLSHASSTRIHEIEANSRRLLKELDELVKAEQDKAE